MAPQSHIYGVPYASFGKRVLAHLIDSIPSIVATVIWGVMLTFAMIAAAASVDPDASTSRESESYFYGPDRPPAVYEPKYGSGSDYEPELSTEEKAAFGGFVVVYLLGIPILILGGLVTMYSTVIVQGRTGRSWGKAAMGIRLVREETGLAPGWPLALGRHFAHGLDGMVMYVGYLFPLFTDKRQTIADMVCKTVVVVDTQKLPGNVSSFGSSPVSPVPPTPNGFQPGFQPQQPDFQPQQPQRPLPPTWNNQLPPR